MQKKEFLNYKKHKKNGKQLNVEFVFLFFLFNTKKPQLK